MDQNPWKPNAEGEVAWAGTEVCVVEEGQHHWMAVKEHCVEAHLDFDFDLAAVAATAAASSVPAVAGILVVKISETV